MAQQEKTELKDRERLWLQDLAEGHEEAYKELFEHYFYPLSSFAGKYLEDQATAEDVVQDVFYQYWLKRIKFEVVWELKTYFYRAVRNKCIDILKSRRLKMRYATEQCDKEKSEFFLTQILEEELYFQLKKAVNELPEQYRQVFILVLLGHENQEIADELNLTLDTVKMRKRRGKRILQEKLRDLTWVLSLLSIG